MAQIDGEVEPGFEGVREAFAANFDRYGEVGAACAVHVAGRKVVDLWGGAADAGTGRPYAEDTLQLIFSSTKGPAAVCANLLAQRGDLDVDAPVADYWPEFASAGKADVPVRWLLCHKAGLPVVDADLTLEQVLAWDPIVEALAAQAPIWEPGTAHGYHALTYGWLVGEVVRRVTGKTLGEHFAVEVAEPLGLELWIGLPEAEEHRVAPLITMGVPSDPEARKLYDQFMGPETLTGRALLGPSLVFGSEGVWNRRDVHAAEVPAANGIGTARSLSRLYAGLIGEVDGVRILSPATVDAARTVQTEGADRVLFFESKFGLGFLCSSPFSPYGGPGGFGHSGAGGSVGFADPEAGVAFAYVMNRMMQNLAGDPRTIGLIDATYAALRR
jgi:CubicO group peptidase (beta-lactamase class C family)